MVDLPDVLIIGGGPAGSTAALACLARGLRPLVVERARFPRYHIGESMTGECGSIVRRLGMEELMTQAQHPVKHGVCVFGSAGRTEWFVPVMQRTDEGALEDAITWSVRRSRFDVMLLEEAARRGAELIEGRAVSVLAGGDGASVRGVRVRGAGGAKIEVRAKFVLDCSGQATFLANQKVTGPKYLGAYDKQVAIFGQVLGYARDRGAERALQPGNTHIFYTRKYHWAWAIPLDNEVTSIGFVVPAQSFLDMRVAKDDFFRRQLQEMNPGLAARTAHAETVGPVRVIANYSYQVDSFAGAGFLCVGDAHRFVDPIFSFGLYISMKEALLAADRVAEILSAGRVASGSDLRDHARHCEGAIDMIEDLTDGFWENPLAFSVLVHRRYREALMDLFAGRIYEDAPDVGRGAAVAAFRKLLGRTRSYDRIDDVSRPIGSRFRPERARIWNADLDRVETTERWMRELDA